MDADNDQQEEEGGGKGIAISSGTSSGGGSCRSSRSLNVAADDLTVDDGGDHLTAASSVLGDFAGEIEFGGCKHALAAMANQHHHQHQHAPPSPTRATNHNNQRTNSSGLEESLVNLGVLDLQNSNNDSSGALGGVQKPPNFQDYLRAQQDLKMKSFRVNHAHFAHQPPTTSSHDGSRTTNNTPQEQHQEHEEPQQHEKVAHRVKFAAARSTSHLHLNPRQQLISIASRRQSLIQDSADWKSFMMSKEVEKELLEGSESSSSSGDEDFVGDGGGGAGAGAGADDDGNDEDHPKHHHHHHHVPTIPFYCSPVQRQRWGDDQVLPHINWGDLFFDLFYVAAAYNLGVMLLSAMNNDDWSRGVVYFIGIFGPLYTAWENDLYYSSRYTLIDHFHRIFDIVRFMLVASIVLHIKTLDVLSDSSSLETVALMASIFLEAVMTLVLNIELVWYADGDRKAIVTHTMRKIKHQFLPMATVYLAATVVAAVYFVQSKNEQETDYYYSSGTAGYGDTYYDKNSTGKDDHYYDSDGANSTSTGSDYNTTYYEDGGGDHRILAGETKYEDEDAGDYAFWGGTVWGTRDLPYILCCLGYSLNIIVTAARKLRMDLDQTKDIREYFVPNNTDYLIHRYGEWTMLMIGESILSLLIVETVESTKYYMIAMFGALTVIVLQILKFESEPSHSDGHALWRNMKAAILYSLLIQILSVGLIAFGVSYKVLLTNTAMQFNAENDGYASSSCEGGSNYGDDDHRLLAGAVESSSCLEDDSHRRLAAAVSITDHAASALYSGSLTLVLVSLELMLTTHGGVLKNYERLFKKLEHKDWSFNYPLLFIAVAKIALIAFTATMSRWQSDPTKLALFGFFIVSAFAISRIVSWGIVNKEEEIKRMLHSARTTTVGAARAAGKFTNSVTKKVSHVVAASIHSNNSSRHSIGGDGSVDYDRAVWDSSFDAIVVTDPTGIIRHVNQTCLQVFGYEDEKELVGNNITLLVGGGEAENHAGYLEEFRKSEKNSSTIGKERVLYSRRKDGSEFPCIVGIKILPGSGDLIGYIRNTTGLNQKDDQTKILDPVSRLMDDSSFDSILATTKDGEIVGCNVTALSEFGYLSKEDLLGQNISVLVGGGHASKHDKYLSKFQKKKKSETVLGKQRVLRARRADGSEFACLIAINTIPDTDGYLVGHIRNIHGVSKALKAQHAEDMSAMSRNSNIIDLIDESFDSIIVTTETGTIQRINTTAVEAFGYDTKEELIGQNLSLLVGGGMADKHDMLMKRFVDSGKSESTIGRQRVLYSRRKDGTEFKCIIGIKRMKNTNLLVGYVRDVSELEELQNSSVEIVNMKFLDPVERLIDNESFDSIIVIDFSGIIIRVNKTAIEEFGYGSKEALEGQNVSILVGGNMAHKHDNYLKKFREAGGSSSTIGKQRVLHSKRKDGTEFPSIIGIRTIPDTDYLIGYIKNMTGIGGVPTSGA